MRGLGDVLSLSVTVLLRFGNPASASSALIVHSDLRRRRARERGEMRALGGLNHRRRSSVVIKSRTRTLRRVHSGGIWAAGRVCAWRSPWRLRGGSGPRAGPSCSRLRLPMNESARLHPLDADCTLPKDALYLDALWAPLGHPWCTLGSCAQLSICGISYRSREPTLPAADQPCRGMLPSSPLRSERQGASPVALSEGDDTRDAWSCPPPNEIFTVGSQGRDEEIAGLGVAVALHSRLTAGGTPARHASQPLDPVPLCLPSH